MRIDLAVPYHQKDKAKSLGARWDGIKRVWYVVDVSDLSSFIKWIPSIPDKGKKPSAWQKVLHSMK
jgi:hypothetical protein